MNCDDVRDLVPAYVFGAATDEEMRLVDEHIATCREHDADIDEARATAHMLSEGVPSIVPPTSLRDRIMSQALGTDAGPAPAPAPVLTVAPPSSKTGWMLWLNSMSLRAHPIAAVFLVVIGGLLVWNVMLQTEHQPEKFTHYYWGNDADWLLLETVLGEPGAEVSLGGIDRLDEAHRYYLWATRNESTLLVGDFNVNPEGRWAGEFDFTFEQGDRLWITVEDAAGATQPTTDAVIRTRFQ